MGGCGGDGVSNKLFSMTDNGTAGAPVAQAIAAAACMAPKCWLCLGPGGGVPPQDYLGSGVKGPYS